MSIGRLRNFRDVGTSLTEGRVVDGHFRRAPSQATAANVWADLSMASGNPPANFYASDPAAFATLNGLRGIYHGGDVDDAALYLQSLELCTSTAGFVGEYLLVDILGYYPFVDMDDLNEQPLDNTVTLPRYESGDGVMVYAVQLTPAAGGGTFTFTYVDDTGTTRISPTITCQASSLNIASFLATRPATAAANGPFLPLTSPSLGVRSLTSVTPISANGGLAAFVLCKPLAAHYVYEINTPAERSYLGERPGPPRILDGAYLSLIVRPAATIAAGNLVGRARFIWN